MPTCDPMILMQNRGPVPKEATSRATMPSGNNASASAGSRSSANRQHSDRYPPTISPYAAGLPFPPVASHLRPPLNVSLGVSRVSLQIFVERLNRFTKYLCGIV